MTNKLFKKFSLNLILIIGSLLMIFPFIWMIFGAFKPASELQRPLPSFFPEDPSLRNFERIFTLYPFGKFFLNSVIVTVITVISILFSSSLLGYIFAKFKYRWLDFIFILVIASMIIPLEVKLVPMFMMIKDFKWEDSYRALIIPFIIDSFGIYLFKEYIRNIPQDYIDSAQLDGANEWGIFFRIILPLTGPVFSALAIFSFVYCWDQLLWPLVVINSDSMKTLPLGIILLSNQRGIIYDLTLAAGLLSVIPPLIIFIIFQKHIVKGAIMTGLKG
jgi:multiple sugar transport system permease protein